MARRRSQSKNVCNGQRHGMALLVVVVLVMLISLGAYRFSFYMESQYRVTRTAEEQVHARLAAISGLELASAMVESPTTQRRMTGGLENNESAFRDIVVSEEPVSQSGERAPNAWRFCLVSPLSNERTNGIQSNISTLPGSSSHSMRFGLENEAAKLHIPTLLAWDRMKPGHARTTLLGLPGTNEAMVDAWLRELGILNQATNGGTENRNAHRDDLRMAWFGGDLNQNYQLDPFERRLLSQNMGKQSGGQRLDIAPKSIILFSPLKRYLTWYSGHRNLNRNGTPRVNLNDPDLPALHRNLTAVWPADRANFVIAMRQFGPGSGVPNLSSQALLNSPTPNAGSVSASQPASQVDWVQNWSPDLSKSAVYAFRNSLELIGAVVDLPPTVVANSAKGSPNTTTSAKRIVRSPFSSDLSDARNYLSGLLDDVTIDLSPITIGRVDASDASLEVLAGVPGLDLTLAQRIIQLRTGSTNASKREDENDTIAWLVDAMDIAKLKELEPYLTSRSDVYSVQSVGYRDNQSAVYRITATIDACTTPTQLRNTKVWHPWDRGFSIEQLAASRP